ncbi:MAG: AAA family ATPase [Bacteroidetes bacterium]|nr:MAG: AAA family ATPase [Bacteroidota bacterium]
MEELLNLSNKLVNDVPVKFKRYLFGKINWNNRLIGIKGARGTGKTTLLLQWLKQKGMPSSKGAYLSLDDIYFTSHSLLDTGNEFYQKGGKFLVLDEVHKYPHWAREIKNLYDRYNDLQIIFTGSSIIDISRQEGDLSRRVLMHELPGLSYREYLKMNGYLDVEAITMDIITENNQGIRNMFPTDFRPLEYFDDYLMHGYYPFYSEDKTGYRTRLRQLVRQIVESDMAEIKGFDIRNAKKMLQLIYIIAQQVPFKPNIVKLSQKSQIHRNSIINYLYFLEEARLIRLLYPSGVSIATLQKPEKIFLNDSNLLYAIAENQLSKGTIRETFFLNQVSVLHRVNQPENIDFEVNGKYLFEVGGTGKNNKQIKGLSNAFVVKDSVEYPAGNALPLWIFGFLY